MAENFSTYQPAWCKNTYIRVINMLKQSFHTVSPWKHIIIHTPYPVSSTAIRIVYAHIKSTGTSYILLMYYMNIRLSIQPFCSAVGASVVYNYNLIYRTICSKAIYCAFKQVNAVICYYYGTNFYISSVPLSFFLKSTISL